MASVVRSPTSVPTSSAPSMIRSDEPVAVVDGPVSVWMVFMLLPFGFLVSWFLGWVSVGVTGEDGRSGAGLGTAPISP